MRRARRRFPDEYIESIYGRSGKAGQVQICSFEAIDHDATRKNITDWDENDMPNGEKWGPLTCLGTIHTHPRVEEVSPSEDDWEFYEQQGETISAVCCFWRGKKRKVKSRVRFFFSQAILSVQYGA